MEEALPRRGRRVTPLPRAGETYADQRGEGRRLRVAWHTERDVVVLSLWRDNVCTGTFQLTAADAADLVDVLGAGRDVSYAAALGQRRAVR
ncbi:MULTISPECIES: hypothetical protein [unclassified Nocardioides]|jgi:hypothetical protein|uniref:hypothetical protein n=1 Tax=unclassified Nocardioides TaxID=2615069 RepID=UPI000703AB5D|nr:MULTISPECIES: hypothetical protein [unclassified Nocardioides]KRC50170.1 hypothetical protein ASE19_16315 [Nocardioides sp. Root79]KRC75637.1 hypothetical protein ASE20_22335 [Nocardioides sp. Root240]